MEKILKIINSVSLLILALSLLYIAMQFPDLIERLYMIAEMLSHG
ncbi:MAG: hypothetical protein ACQEXQ_06755 [Bacillota bacterium]